VEEIDHGIGEIMKALKQNRLEKNTLIVFTSDNGPWLPYRQHGGSAGPLRNGKGTTWEGGMREPTIFWHADIRPGLVRDIGSTLDLFSTICHLTGAELPDDRTMDSVDLTPALFHGKPGSRRVFFFYRGSELYAVRRGPYKLHLITEDAYKKDNQKTFHDPPLLFNVQEDPGEQFDIYSGHPDIAQDILDEIESHRSNLIAGEDQLMKRLK
jgi:arylsulfatase A-like enzyme